MSDWLGRAKVWAVPAMAGAVFLLALILLRGVHHGAALSVAITVAVAIGCALIIERK